MLHVVMNGQSYMATQAHLLAWPTQGLYDLQGPQHHAWFLSDSLVTETHFDRSDGVHGQLQGSVVSGLLSIQCSGCRCKLSPGAQAKSQSHASNLACC